MKRTLLVSLIPFLAPLAAFAEQDKQAEMVTPVPGTKVKADSWRASQVMGLDVKNAADETIGDVKDLVLDMKSGRILAVVISSGGFLGTGDTLSAVPVTALRYDDTAKAFKTNLTKEQLGQTPQFNTATWSDNREHVSVNTERSERASNDGGATDQDNTAQNEKEADNDEANPTDQGNSDKDVQITKDIRSSIMNKDLSFNAKNIKIITRNEYVTLKGVVESHEEHEAVLKIARNHANTAKITDDLKVNDK